VFLTLRSNDQMVGELPGTQSGSELQQNPCAPPGLTKEQCLWECDDIASACVAVGSVEGTQCYHCRDRRPARCEAPTIPEDECLKACTETCTFQYLTQSRGRCSTCDTKAPPTSCEHGTLSEQQCQSECEAMGQGQCEPVPTTEDSATCYRCMPKAACAANQFRSVPDCQKLCEGSCFIEANGCVSCLDCPSGSFPTRTECRETCSQDCQQSTTNSACWQCPRGCNETCVERGYEPARDYQRQIDDALAEAVCVSGVRIAMSRAQVGSCECTKAPQLTFETTVPVCEDTPCGDIACGSQKTCTGADDQPLIAACRWKGWKEIGEFRYQAQIQVGLDSP